MRVAKLPSHSGGTLQCLSAAREFPIAVRKYGVHYKILYNKFILFHISEKMNFYSVVKSVA